MEILWTQRRRGRILDIPANSKCLKNATIFLKPMLDSELEKNVIIEKLKGIPRVLTSSQLLVN